MVECPRCKIQFQYKCRLTQHMKRVKPCEVVSDVQDGTDVCRYCIVSFKTSRNARRHEDRCKQKYDSVRQMEVSLCIQVDTCEPNVCRFCNNEYSRPNNLNVHLRTCKKKKEYSEHLMDRLRMHTGRRNAASTLGHNVTNTNNGVININVNPPLAFGKENRDYVTREFVMRLWERCQKSPERFVSKLIAHVHTNPSHPENHNVIYSNARSGHAKVFNGDSYELQLVDDIITQASSNSLDHMMGELYDPSSASHSSIGTIMNTCDSVDEDTQSRREMIRQARLALYNRCPKLKRTQVADALPMPPDVAMQDTHRDIKHMEALQAAADIDIDELA